MSAPPERRPIRRVVTGHDAAGHSKVLVDEVVSGGNERDGRFRSRIWSSAVPAEIPLGEGATAPVVHDAVAYGADADLLVFDFLPGNVIPMHRTETLDYVIVLDGEIEMDLDEGTVRLRAGELLVQRGTNHVWRNSSDRIARVAFVMLPAKPLSVSPGTTRASRTGEPHAPA